MLDSMWDITLALAPWLLLGTLVAGLLHVLLPPGFVRRQLRGRFGVLKAVGLGVPLPLCSCGVIPAGLGLKRDGASNGASIGFLISTPQTGVDSVFVSASFLGWPFALFKVVAALVTGLIGGLFTDWVDTENQDTNNDVEPSHAPERSVQEMVWHSLDIVRSIWVWLVVGIVASALIQNYVPDSFFGDVSGHGDLLSMLAILAVSLPLYVCATASVPIAAAFVAGGMPAGAAIVFLMAGPATNVATVGAVYRGFGRRALTIYLLTIVVGSMLAGFAFEEILSQTDASGQVEHLHEAWWAVACGVVFCGLMGFFAIEELRNRLRRAATLDGEGATIHELSVAGMTCNGCVNKLRGRLEALEGVAAVEVFLEPGSARVQGTITVDQFRQTIEDAGFTPV
mgnify:CR=1 FL=1